MLCFEKSMEILVILKEEKIRRGKGEQLSIGVFSAPSDLLSIHA